MTKTNVKILIRDLEIAIAALKSEVYSDIDAYMIDSKENITIGDDNDGEPD
tara:strand:+ start:1106 stop:1258 length:153 start_codon:yes stop_codon:yes gene_type:complete